MTTKQGFSRRDALRLGLAGAFGATLATSFAGRAAALPFRGMPGKKLLVIFRRGAGDCLNEVVPFGDTVGYNAGHRPTLFLPTASSIDIDVGNTFCKLHPALGALGPVGTAGTVLNQRKIVFLHQVGNPTRTGSHFEDQRTWETAISQCSTDPDLDKEEGWVTRAAELLLTNGGFSGVSVSTGLQQLFQTSDPARVQSHVRRVLSFPNDAAPSYTLASAMPALDAKYAGAPPSSSTPFGYGLNAHYLAPPHVQHDTDGLARAAGLAAVEGVAQIAGMPTYVPGAGVTYPFGHPSNPAYPTPASLGLPDDGQSRGFFAQLRDAMWILNDTDAQVAGVELGGWDTHSNQGGATGRHADLLAIMGHALDAIYQDSQAQANLGANLLTVVISEFGRTSAENASLGTDHGAGTCVWVLGDAVQQNMTDPLQPSGSLAYECDATTWAPNNAFSANSSNYFCTGTTGGTNAFLKVEHDFRIVFGEILRTHFGASSAVISQVLPGFTMPTPTPLPFL